jgi:ribosomal protein L12E/L44/L45/RPP1/RPP2
LIAGHRGAGKTTLVLKAVQDVLNSVAPGNIRPLLVALHGPDLLAPLAKKEAPQAAKPQTGDTEDAATKSNGKEKDEEQENKANENTNWPWKI